MQSTEPAEYACPRCDRTPLERSDGGLSCRGCRVTFPLIGGLPWLFAEPGAALDDWRGRLHFLLRDLEQREQAITAALDDKSIGDRTRQRLERLAAATESHRQRLGQVLEPLELAELTAERNTYLALRTKLPADQGLTTYYGNVHRDWCWGEAENDATIEIVLERLADRAPGRSLVLGCGAGRLAHDFHTRAGPGSTQALDFNPFLVLIADRMSRGETLELYEFPVAPIDLEHSAVLRRLAAPGRADVAYCIGDVHRPPWPARSFDTIITPWLIDILPEPFEQIARRINRLLRDDGCWINLGSLSFHDAAPARQLSPEECIAGLDACGFTASGWHDRTIPYLASPASRHARSENVLSWTAVKAKHISRTDRYEALPDWIVRGKDPIPVLPHFRNQATATKIHAFILGLIDGRRSIADMAAVLEQQRLMPKAEAEASIRQFMMTLYAQSQRGTRY